MAEKTNREEGLSRRSFVKWSALAGAAATMTGGLVACTSDGGSAQGNASTAGDSEATGVWKTAPCPYNCSCTSSRCLLRTYVVDGVPQKIITDQSSEDTLENPQKRACARGRAQISMILSGDRVKYPMRRKGWSPDNPNGEMRGKDEWERISWDEAMGIFISQTKKVVDKYGTKGILLAAYRDIGDTYFDQTVLVFYALGGGLHHDWATVSLGSWPAVESTMTGGMLDAPDNLSLLQSDLHILYGCNWTANKSGNTGLQLHNCKAGGAKVVIIDPWLNQTAQALADEWVPVRPGTDAAFTLGMAYHQIKNGLFDQTYLDTYCVGFDAAHMPEGADPKDNFKDYVLGTYDGEPKTPEWAEAISGVPAATTRRLAEEIANTRKVNFFAGQSTTKIPAGELFGQIFYTFAWMHGGIGTEGNFASWVGLHEGMSAAPYAMAGDSSNGAGKNPSNPFSPPLLAGRVPDFAKIQAEHISWDRIEYSELWQSCLDGSYGRDEWPGGKKPLDIHMIYAGGYQNSFNSLPNTNAAIKLYKQVDFVVTADPFFTSGARYSDLVLPVASWWEKGELAWHNSSDAVYWADRVIEPIYESRTEAQICRELAVGLGIDPDSVDTMTAAERTYYSLKGAMRATDDKGGYAPLLTITQADLDELGVKGEAQEGLMTIAEFKQKGFYKIRRALNDSLMHNPYAAFIADPVANPLKTASGKFEIYSAALATIVNSACFSKISPIGKWQFNANQGQGAQTSQYPLLLWTPHTLRRSHTINDSVTSLREAFPQECFMSTIDAEARGIKSGDIVLMSSPYGKVLRPAKVMPTVVPGAVALQDGAWTTIDEETGIDIGGNPNILQAPAASGQGVQAWTGTIC